MCRTTRRGFYVVALVLLCRAEAVATLNTFQFAQLDWQGTPSSTPNSSWGRVVIDFTGFATTQYFNLNVNGNWVVQNMGIDSLFGVGNNQVISTTFDLNVANGTNVNSINWGFNVGPAPGGNPGVTFNNTPVIDLPFEIGGEKVAGVTIDLGGGGAKPAPDPPAGNNAATVVQSAKLPNIGQMPNQPQGKNECAPGAVSNSVKYLINTGQIPPLTTSDISDLRLVLGTDALGSPITWYQEKKDYYHGVLDTQFLTPDKITELIDAVNAGKDVEVDLDGHVAVVVGVRRYSDGRVELDLYDDNQTDNLSDPVRTVQIVGGKIDGRTLERFVVEGPVVLGGGQNGTPEPSAFALAALGVVSLCTRRRHKRR